MTKKVLIAILAVLLIVGLTSCSDGGSGGGGQTDPKRPATLTVSSFTEYYPVGTEKPSGSLLYTSTDGKITSVGINDEGVTHNFDGKTAGEGKLLKITYNGIDATKTYSVVKPDDVNIDGVFILGDKTTYIFKKGSTSVTKEVWTSFGQYYGLTGATESELTYTVGISPSGRTTIRLDGWTYTPKDSGLAGYPSEDDFFDSDSGYTPNMGYFYVSTDKEDSRSTTNTAAQGKFCVMMFDVNYNAYFWFTTDVKAETLAALSTTTAVKITPDKMSFDNAGLKFKGVNADVDKGKNLEILLNRENYASKTRAFGFISTGEGDYKGYQYTMKLTDVPVITPAP